MIIILTMTVTIAERVATINRFLLRLILPWVEGGIT